MAITLPIVSEFTDKGVKSAEAAFKNFKTQVGNAEGAMGKFKAGSKAAMDFVETNAAAFATAAAGSLIKFAADGVQAFQDLALSAGKLSTATGLAVDDASRYMEVLGDIGIDVGTLETAIGKLGRAAANEAPGFEQLGAQIAYTKTGAVDINETFINVIDQLNKMEDPAQRAKIATELLGKGWQGMSELIGMGADDLRASLASVSDAKVIDAAEVKKARDFRAAMDDLKDAVDDVTLVVGSTLVPYLTDLAQQTKNVMDVKVGGKNITDYMTAIGTTALDQVNPLARLEDTMSGVARITGENNSVMERGYGVLETTMSVVPVLGDAFSGLGNAIFGSSKEVKDFSKVGADLWGIIKTNMTNPIDDLAERALPDVTYAWDTFLGQLTRQDAYDEAKRQVDELNEAIVAAFNGEEINADQIDSAVRDAQRAIGDLVATMLAAKEITGAEANAILFNVKAGQLEYATQLLQNPSLLQDTSNMSLAPGQTYIPGIGTFGTNSTIGAQSATNVTINMPAGSSGDDVVRAMQRWSRNNGAVPLPTTTTIQR